MWCCVVLCGAVWAQVGEDLAPLFMKLLLCGLDKRVYNCQVCMCVRVCVNVAPPVCS